MTAPSTHRISSVHGSANAWLEVFNSLSKPAETASEKKIVSQLNSVAQAVPAHQPDATTSGSIPSDEARLARKAQVTHAIHRLPKDMAEGMKAQLSAFLTIGVGREDALQCALDAINRAAVRFDGGHIHAARDILMSAIRQLAPCNQAGGHPPPAPPPAAPSGQTRPPGA